MPPDSIILQKNIVAVIRACWVDFCQEINRLVDTIIRAPRVDQIRTGENHLNAGVYFSKQKHFLWGLNLVFDKGN